MICIEDDTRSGAWKKALQHLKNADDWMDYNLVLSIKNPSSFGNTEKQVEDEVDSFLKQYECSLDTVAQTIFPASQYIQFGPRGVYDVYPEDIYPKIKGRWWGTYAHRLVRSTSGGRNDNPLKSMVEKMKSQLQSGNTKRACYEVSTIDLALDCNLYDNDKDFKRPIGGPCLSHLSFKITKDKSRINLTALYRNHYYIERALGNFRGLAFLMSFVAKEVGLEVGELLVVSTYAKIDHGTKWPKDSVNKLLGKIL